MEAAQTVAPAALEAVSCTMVALPGVHSASGLQSHVFRNLFVPATALQTHPTDGISVNIYAMLSSIFFSIGFSNDLTGEVPPIFHKLLIESASYPIARVATTSVPIFDKRMQDPANGFLNLGYLSSITSLSTSPSPLILAIDTSHPQCPELRGHLRSLGRDVRLERHFIIIIFDYDEQHTTTPAVSLPFPLCYNSAPSSDYRSHLADHGNTSTSPSPSPTSSCPGPFSARIHFPFDIPSESSMFSAAKDHTDTNTRSSPSFPDFDFNNSALFHFGSSQSFLLCLLLSSN